jgi:hypothetical protein
MELAPRLKKTLISWYLTPGQGYLLGSFVGNFSNFSFEMEVQDGAPCSLKDTVSHNWSCSTSPSAAPQNLNVFKVGSVRLKRTEIHTIAGFKVFNLQLESSEVD